MQEASMSLQSLAVLLPYTGTSSISNAQLDRLKRLPTTSRPIGLRWARRRLLVTNAAPRRQEPSKEISLDNHDLMALEFGRLLGESQEKTISKVLRRKIDPASTYIGIEKQAKGGKGLTSKADFAVKVERPKRASMNASTLAPDLPRLAFPPSRQNGMSINLPKPGEKVALQVDMEEILDNSMLRKPSFSQGSRVGLPQSPFTSPAVDNVKKLGSQSKMVVKEGNEDLEMLRRPSVAVGQGLGKAFSDSNDQVKGNNTFSLSKSVTKSPSQELQPEVATMPENSDSMEASKLEFQRLLDKSFNTSSASSLSNLASSSVRQDKLSRESFETAQQDSRLELSFLKRPHRPTLPFQSEGDQPSDKVASLSTLQSEESIDLQDDEFLKESREDFQYNLDAAPALPDLTPPPSRHRGSIGTFVQPSRARNKATQLSMKIPTNEALDETLLRKPRNQASDDVTLSPMQHSEEFCNPQDDQSLKSSKANLQHNLDEPSAIPFLAAPPSRHKGSFGTFVQPGRSRIRGIQSPSKEPVNEVVDEYLLQKPSPFEKGRDNMDSTSRTEANTVPLSSSKQIQLENEIIDDDILRKPLMEADTTQTDVKTSIINYGNAFEEVLLKGDHKQHSTLKDNVQCFDVENSLHVSNGSNVGQDEAFATESEQISEPFSKIETPAQFYEELSQQRTPNGLDGARRVTNGVSSVALPGGLQDVDHSSGVKTVKVAALKKPVRFSSADPEKGHTSEGKSVRLDLSLNSGSSSDVTQQSSNSSVEGEEIGSGKLYMDLDLKILHRECEVEESVGSQLAEPINVGSFLPEQASFEDQNRNQMAHDQLTAVPTLDQTNEILLDEATYIESVSAAKETPTSDNLKMPQMPSQLTPVELLTQRSERMDLQASNTKLHQAKEEEEKAWARAEVLLKAKEQVEVKLIGSNSAGLFVSFGCLVGFLSSFELSPKRGLVDFTSWAQQKGIDLSQKRGSLKSTVNDAGQSAAIIQNVENGKPTTVTGGDPNELKNKYKEEVSKLMSSFVGESTKVIVKLVDKSRRKLKFSEKETDPGCREHVQKKANLMADLKLGQVVTCEVKSITPIGVFVEVDGVPALIHHSEVSWNTRVDPAALLNVGEVIKAKVCRLDRTLQRINLSLKQMQPDPLKRTLESVVGDPENDSSMREVEALESMEVVWPELGDLMKKLEQMDHILRVSRGRCLYSAAFAPTFQVLISTPQSKGYKLLARFGNKIQEVLVDTTLDRDKMKECIRLCTFSEA